MSTQSPIDSVNPSVRQDTVRLNFDLVKPAAQEPEPESKPKKKQSHALITILIWVVVGLVIIALGLVISSLIAGFSTVFAMIDWIIAQL